MSALLARLVNPVIWRIPGHGARKLFSFSLAEHGSMLDLSLAAQKTCSQERQSRYLHHMLDEARHARMFATKSAELRREDGRESFGFPVADTEDLFELLGEVRFLAFVHRGETRGRKQFESYRDWFGKRGDRKSEAMFTAIVKDELRHEGYTRDLLVSLAGGEEAARKELRAVALWEKWRTWRRLGRFLAEKVYFVAMGAVYLLAGPLAKLAELLRRPPQAGWTEHGFARVENAPAVPATASLSPRPGKAA